MKKLIVAAVCLLFSAATLSAQDYNWAIGVRGGGMASGLTVKHNISATNAWEGVLNTWYGKGVGLSGLYEWTMPVITDGFSFYYGVGAHLGFGSDSWFGVGADGVVGLEYKIPTVPIAVSLDYRPYLNFAKDFYFGAYDFGFGVKFCF